MAVTLKGITEDNFIECIQFKIEKRSGRIGTCINVVT